MTAWFPAVDDAVEGGFDVFGSIGDAAGDAAGGFFSPLGNFIIQMTIIVGIFALMVVWAS